MGFLPKFQSEINYRDRREYDSVIDINKVDRERFSKNSEKTHWVYVISDNDGAIKIGRTNNPITRLNLLQGANKNRLTIDFIKKFRNNTSANKEEMRLHKLFKKDHIRGEWFKQTTEVTNYFCEWTHDILSEETALRKVVLNLRKNKNRPLLSNSLKTRIHRKA